MFKFLEIFELNKPFIHRKPVIKRKNNVHIIAFISGFVTVFGIFILKKYLD